MGQHERIPDDKTQQSVHLEREINLARNIQMRLLNGETPTLQNGEVTGLSIPARLIGGDYYDFSLLPNGKLRIVIGDVMGKGIPAAMLMILTRSAFKSTAEYTKGPGETLQEMNRVMYQDLRALGSFVTVCCADWDPKERTFTYANAGHHVPVIVRKGKAIEEVKPVKGVMIGGLPNQQYPENTLLLDNEDFAFFYTDGIIEARNHDGEMYRLEKLYQLLLKHAGEDAKTVEEKMIEDLQAFTGNVPQRDDITMVVLKVADDQTDITSYTAPIIHN